MRAALGFLGACALIQTAALAQSEDPKDLLLRVRASVLDTVKRLPKYMCSLTVERAVYAGPPHESRSCDALIAQHNQGTLKTDLGETDRLRLDVGVAGLNEMFSWVGENRFDDKDLFDLVGQGALQVGDFSGFLTTIFGGEDADFSYDGQTQINGRMLAKFGFRVDAGKSHYVFSNRQLGRETVTGYEGYFLADPGTGDLVRLLIRTNSDISETGSCESDTRLDYIRVRLNNSEFLLPRESELHIVTVNGGERTNRTTYANCHEFLGESELRFDIPVPEAITRAAKSSGPPAIPAKLPFKLVFTQSIDANAAAAGDKIKAKLASPIRNASTKEILVPAGADVVARITRFQYFPKERSILMLVTLESAMARGEQVPLAATTLLELKPGSGSVLEAPGLRRRVPLGSFRSLTNPKSGVFEFRRVGQDYVIPSGLKSDWVTIPPK